MLVHLLGFQYFGILFHNIQNTEKMQLRLEKICTFNDMILQGCALGSL